VDGQWTGTVTGETNANDAVTGTISFDVTGATLTGQLTVSVGGNALPAQSFTGTQTCGQIQASQSESVLGVTITATLDGTMTASAATGTWTASGGTASASGTFTATK
jgi:hypothetical protein